METLSYSENTLPFYTIHLQLFVMTARSSHLFGLGSYKIFIHQNVIGCTSAWQVEFQTRQYWLN
jgi:hypothetical protein